MTGLITTVYKTGDIESVFACVVCGVAIVPRDHRQHTCGARACRDKRNEAHRNLVKRAIACRERSRRWAEAHRNVRNPQPWLAGAPPYPTHLPGGGLEIECRPHPRWPVEHRNARGLHGMITDLVGEAHSRDAPDFSLVPWRTPFGWGVYFRDEARARKLERKVFDAVLFDQRVSVRFGALWRLKAPDFRRVPRGRKRMLIDVITPVVIQNSERTITREKPTRECLTSTLTNCLANRLGLKQIGVASVRIDVAEDNTRAESTPILGKFGVVKGFVGSFVVEANAPARWMLACAEIIGLGGRTALGFGRIKCTPLK